MDKLHNTVGSTKVSTDQPSTGVNFTTIVNKPVNYAVNYKIENPTGLNVLKITIASIYVKYGAARVSS